MTYSKSERGTSWSTLIVAIIGVCAASATAIAKAGPSCDSVFPMAMVQDTYTGKEVRALPNQPARGALMMNCAYRVSGAGTLSLKLFGATLESPYTTTIAQMVKEGYKCQSIDEAVGFPASNCGLTAGSMTINSIVFTTTNGVYAAILTDVAAVGAGSPLMPMYSMAKLVNSNASAH